MTTSYVATVGVLCWLGGALMVGGLVACVKQRRIEVLLDDLDAAVRDISAALGERNKAMAAHPAGSKLRSSAAIIPFQAGRR